MDYVTRLDLTGKSRPVCNTKRCNNYTPKRTNWEEAIHWWETIGIREGKSSPSEFHHKCLDCYERMIEERQSYFYDVWDEDEDEDEDEDLDYESLNKKYTNKIKELVFSHECKK